MVIKINKQFQNDLKDIQDIFKKYFSKEYKTGEYYIKTVICTDGSWDIEVDNGSNVKGGEKMLFRNIAILKRNSVKVTYQVVTTKPYLSDKLYPPKDEDENYDIEKEHFNKIEYIKPIQDFIIPINLNFKEALSKIINCKDTELSDAFFEYRKLCELLEEDKTYVKLDKKLKSVFDLGDGLERLDDCVLDIKYGKLYQDAMERVFTQSDGLILKKTIDRLSTWRKIRWKENNKNGI